MAARNPLRMTAQAIVERVKRHDSSTIHLEKRNPIQLRVFSHENYLRNISSWPQEWWDWSLGDWGCAAAGEVGEMCNKIKKRANGKRIDTAVIGEEIADAVTYLDLIATRLGLDLGTILVNKFNKVSKRVKSEYRLR
jgi:NTP pyrophosphatase (non-canonical NTP hydrolase)